MSSSFPAALRTSLAALLVCAAPSFLGGVALADTIRLASGEVLDGVNVQEETLAAVFYRKGGSAKEVPSDQVVSIAYDEFPNLVQKAEDALADDDVDGAIESYTLYAEGQIANPSERRFKWAPAYAAFRAVELNRSVGRYPAVVASAETLLAAFPGSRFVPSTYLYKAEAQRFTGDAAGAKATLEALKALVEKEKLSERYGLDAELALLEIDPALSTSERAKRVDALVKRAGSKFPTVRRRAELLAGQTAVSRATAAAEAGDAAAVTAALAEARGRFEALLASDDSSDEVRAGAYVGLGDVYFFEAAPGDDVEGLRRAGHEYLKVTVLYPGERRYLVRALFFAGRCFHQVGALTDSQADKDRAQRIFYRLRQEFPGSPLASESRQYR